MGDAQHVPDLLVLFSGEQQLRHERATGVFGGVERGDDFVELLTAEAPPPEGRLSRILRGRDRQ